MVKTSESAFESSSLRPSQTADRLEPKGTKAGCGAPTLRSVDHSFPADSRHLSRGAFAAERGNPVPRCPSGSRRAARRADECAGEDDGRSEGRPVMGRIRVRNMTRPVSGAHVRQVLDREIIDRTKGRRNANDGGTIPTGAPVRASDSAVDPYRGGMR